MVSVADDSPKGAKQVETAINNKPSPDSTVGDGEHKKRKADEGSSIIPHTPCPKHQWNGQLEPPTRPYSRFEELFDEQERSLASFRDTENDIKSLQLEPHPTLVIDLTEVDLIEKALIGIRNGPPWID